MLLLLLGSKSSQYAIKRQNILILPFFLYIVQNEDERLLSSCYWHSGKYCRLKNCGVSGLSVNVR